MRRLRHYYCAGDEIINVLSETLIMYRKQECGYNSSLFTDGPYCIIYLLVIEVKSRFNSSQVFTPIHINHGEVR